LTYCARYENFRSELDCWGCLTENQCTAFDVTTDFIDQQKQIGHGPAQKSDLVKPRKKFAPYTKEERAKRLKAVSKYYFEFGKGGVEIAEILKVDKNTVYSDLRKLHSEFASQNPGLLDEYTKFQVRLQLQRSRLVEQLSQAKSIRIKLWIERQIAALDEKLCRMSLKFYDAGTKNLSMAAANINNYAEKNNLNYRVIDLMQLLKVSPQARQSYQTVSRREGLAL